MARYRLSSILLPAWFVLLPLVGCVAGQPTITILHTNDMHARFEEEEGEAGPTGGILAIAARVAEVRAEEEHVLLFDAGDMLTGHPVSIVSWDGLEGAALFDMMTLIGYDAMAIGNHDFDNGLDHLAAYVDRVPFPMLCANVVHADGSLLAPGVLSHTILTVDGIRIGVIGVVTEALERVTARRNTQGLTVLSVVEVTQQLVDELDPLTDVIILLSHQGYDADLAFAQQVEGVDLILGGHDHRRVEQPKRHGHDTIICQAGCNMRSLGRIDITVGDDRITDYEGSLLELPHRPGEAPAELATLVGELHQQLDAELGVPVGELVEPWERNYYDESNLGTWVAGQLAEATNSPIGFINSGSLRKDQAAGVITLKDVLEIMPFQNYVATFEVTGAQLMTICRHNAWASSVQDHGILQVSGVSYRYRVPSEGEVELLEVTVGGEPVDPAATYRCATNDFIVFDQAEKYLGVVPEVRENAQVPVQDVLTAAVRRHGRIEPVAVGNIVRVD